MAQPKVAFLASGAVPRKTAGDGAFRTQPAGPRAARLPALARPPLHARRTRLDGRVRGRRGPRRHQHARLAARPGDVLRSRDRLVLAPVDPRGTVAQPPGAGRHRDRRARAGPVDRRAAHPARPGVLPAARARDRVRRPVPRRPAPDRALPDRFRGARAAAAGRPHQHRGARHDHPGPRLLRLPRRGLPGRDRVDPSLAAGGGALARAHPPPVDAAGDPPPGRPAGAAAAAQRLRRAAEGRRTDLGARRGRRDPGRADRVGTHVQLHAVRGGGGAVHPARGADRPDRGHRGGPGRAPAGLA